MLMMVVVDGEMTYGKCEKTRPKQKVGCAHVGLL